MLMTRLKFSLILSFLLTWVVSSTAFDLNSPQSTKVVVMKTGNLVTTAVTADQVVLTYTVTAGKTFYLEYMDVTARLTTYATTATNFGNSSLESPAGTKSVTTMVANAGVIVPPYNLRFSEPLPIVGGVVIRVVCTPAATTSFTWQANLGGYER